MARTKPIRRSYGAGEWGRNRVRVFPDPKTGLFQIEWRENGRRLSKVAEAPQLELGRSGRRTSSPLATSGRSSTARRTPSPSRSPWSGFLTSTVKR